MSDDLDALEGAASAATSARMAIEQERDKAIHRLISEVRVSFAGRIAEAMKVEAEARIARDEETVRRALANNADMYQGILVEWRNSRRSQQKEPTGRKGKYEICTRQTAFPIGRRLLPSIGSRFIRLLKNDGTTGLAFAYDPTRWNAESERWLPDSQEPKGAST